jgi:sucrose-6-phosphate hydrolase SacC (GH32 family)
VSTLPPAHFVNISSLTGVTAVSFVTEEEEVLLSLVFAGPNISMSNTSFDGVLSFPREVTIEPESGVLRFAPVKEFMVLRRMHEHQEGVHIAKGGTGVAFGMKGQMLDIEIVFAPSTATEFGVQVLASADFSTEVVRIGFNASRQSAFIDVRNASAGSVGMPWVYDAPLTLTAGRSFALRCLIDMSVLECFFDEMEAGGSQPQSYRRVITARSYFSQPTSAHIGLYSFGAASMAASADVWAVAATDSGW